MSDLEIIPSEQVEDETAIIGYARSPDSLLLENLEALTDERYSLLSPAIANGSDSAQLLSPATERGTMTVSGGGRVENSGNTYHNTYIVLSSPQSSSSRADNASTGTVSAIEVAPADVAANEVPESRVETLPSPSPSSQASDGAGSSPADTSSQGRPVSSVQFSHQQTEIYDRAAYPVARENGCFVEAITPTRGNIPFHDDVPKHAKPYISARGLLDANGKMIPLWEPIPRQFPIEVSEFGAIGDVGYLDGAGGFNSLFNIFLTWQENKDYGYDPPPNFAEYASLKIRNTIIERIYDLQPPGQIFRYSYDGRFVPENYKPESALMSVCSRPSASKEPHGSVVAYNHIVRDRLDKRHDPGRQQCIQAHLNKHAAEWYAHYNDYIRPEIKNGALMLIHSCISTDSWAIASFAHEPKRNAGEYFATLQSRDPQHPSVYKWKVKRPGVEAHASPVRKDENPDVSDYCIAIGANAIFIGDPPPSHPKSKISRGMSSISRSFSAISISASASSFRSRLTIGRSRA